MSGETPRRVRTTLGVGYACLLAALLSATRNPATGYELSIYRATPLPFWLGIGVAVLVALAVGLHPGTGRLYWRGAFLLGYLGGLSVVGLPTIRGYHYVGSGDTLSHLASVRQLSSGTLDPWEFTYPGLHTITVSVSSLSGLDSALAVQLTVFGFFAVYLLAVPLCVRSLADHRGASLAGLFAVLLWLPLGPEGAHRSMHPFSMGVVFLPFVLLLVLWYVSSRRSRCGTATAPTAAGASLALAVVATTLIHPQAAVLVVVLLGTASVVQFAVRWRRPDHPIARHRTTYGQTVFAATVVSLWSFRLERVRSTLYATAGGLLGGAPTGNEVAQRGSSLSELGGTIPELFVKLYLPSVVVMGIAGFYLLWRWFGPDDRWPARDDELVEYVSVGAVPLGMVFAVTFVASVTTQHFRYLSVLILVVSLVGALALAGIGRVLADSFGETVGGTAVAVFFVVMLPLSAMALYSSPYVYQPSPHVTRSSVESYEVVLDHRAQGSDVTSIRGKHQRFVVAAAGTEDVLDTGFGNNPGVTGRVFNTNLTTAYSGWYFPVTRLSYEREVVLYDGFRYSRTGFRRLEATPGVHRVHSTGPDQVYLLGRTGNVTTDAGPGPARSVRVVARPEWERPPLGR